MTKTEAFDQPSAAEAVPRGEDIHLPPLDVLVVTTSSSVINILRETQKAPECRRMTWRFKRKSLEQLIMGGVMEGKPDILIITSDGHTMGLTRHLQALAQETDSETRVIVLADGAEPDARSIRDAGNGGAKLGHGSGGIIPLRAE
jgi:hypothetical protein